MVCYCFSHIRSNTKSWFPKGLQDSREGIAICSPPQKRWAANPIYNHVKPFRTINIAGISGFYFLLLSISLSHPNSSLVGGWPTPLKNMSSSVGMMTFPTEWKVIKFHGSKPPTRYYSGFTHEKMWFSLIFYIPPTNQPTRSLLHWACQTSRPPRTETPGALVWADHYAGATTVVCRLSVTQIVLERGSKHGESVFFLTCKKTWWTSVFWYVKKTRKH